MSKIQELIDKLCPEGVEYKPLGDICECKRGQYLSKSDIGKGSIPMILYGELYTSYSGYITRIQSFTSNESAQKGRIAHYGDILMPISSTTKEAQIGCAASLSTEFPVYIGGDAIILSHNQCPGYLVHYLNSKLFEKQKMSCVSGTTISHLNPSKLLKIEIPVPPMEVQREIVRILDNFSALTSELTVELTARKKQYEFYLRELLSQNLNNHLQCTLGEIGEVKMCKRIMKEQTSEEGDIPFYKIGSFGSKADAFISRDLYMTYKTKYPFPQKGDVLISAAGTIGKTVMYDGEPAYYQDSNIVWLDNDESKVINKYLYYLYQIINWKTDGGTIKRLYNDNLKQSVVSFPPLSEQERIVAILDKFEALTNDLTCGLPAEINARQQQYEYYRDQLLTFKRAV